MKNKKGKYKCHVCGKIEKSKFGLSIFHRGCRLSQLFERDKKGEKELGLEGSGLIIIDPKKPKKPIGDKA